MITTIRPGARRTDDALAFAAPPPSPFPPRTARRTRTARSWLTPGSWRRHRTARPAAHDARTR